MEVSFFQPGSQITILRSPWTLVHTHANIPMYIIQCACQTEKMLKAFHILPSQLHIASMMFYGNFNWKCCGVTLFFEKINFQRHRWHDTNNKQRYLSSVYGLSGSEHEISSSNVSGQTSSYKIRDGFLYEFLCFLYTKLINTEISSPDVSKAKFLLRFSLFWLHRFFFFSLHSVYWSCSG